jgi:hypothetical protein
MGGNPKELKFGKRWKEPENFQHVDICGSVPKPKSEPIEGTHRLG